MNTYKWFSIHIAIIGALIVSIGALASLTSISMAWFFSDGSVARKVGTVEESEQEDTVSEMSEVVDQKDGDVVFDGNGIIADDIDMLPDDIDKPPDNIDKPPDDIDKPPDDKNVLYICETEGHNYVFTINATCWTGGWNTNVCGHCGEIEKGLKDQPVTYGFSSALDHDYETVEITDAGCSSGGGEYVECKRCGYETIINWYDALGHSFGSLQSTDDPLWNVVLCEREGCGHSEYKTSRR